MKRTAALLLALLALTVAVTAASAASAPEAAPAPAETAAPAAAEKSWTDKLMDGEWLETAKYHAASAWQTASETAGELMKKAGPLWDDDTSDI